MANADYTNLSEREKKKLISKYVSKFREALGGIGTNESLASRMVKELRQIGSSDLINDINEAYDEKHNETLRDAIIGDYSGDDEDGMLNSLGFAIDRVGDKSLKLENQDRALLSANNRDLKGSSLDLINKDIEIPNLNEKVKLGSGVSKFIKAASKSTKAPATPAPAAPAPTSPATPETNPFAPMESKKDPKGFMDVDPREAPMGVDAKGDPIVPTDTPVKISSGLPQSVLNTIYGGKAAPYQKDGANPFTETKEPKEPQIGPTQALAKTIKKTVAANASGGGAATGSGSKAGLGYLRSREDMMARDKSVKAAMADEKKERRKMAEDRFAMRRGDILARQAERAKMEQEKKEANEIKSEAGNLLGRVIRDSSGKVVGTSTTKAGRKALGDDYKGAGGGTYDFSKPADSFEELFARDAVKDQMSSRQRQVMDLMNKRASAPLEEAKKREQPFKEGLGLNPSIVDAMQKPPSASDQTPLNVPTASTGLNPTQDIPRGVTNTPPPVTQESSKIQAEKRKEALEKAKREREQRKLLEQTQQADKYSRTA